MPRPLPDDWPRIYIEAKCDSCGSPLFGELYRPAVVELWEQIAEFWRGILELHRADCAGLNSAKETSDADDDAPAPTPKGSPHG